MSFAHGEKGKTMKDCKNCQNGVWAKGKNPIPEVCIECSYIEVDGEKVPSNWKQMPLKNIDRLRRMNDEELAMFICKRCSDCSPKTCPGAELCNGNDGFANGLVKWLNQNAEENNDST